MIAQTPTEEQMIQAARLVRARRRRREIQTGWRVWKTTLFPEHFTYGDAPHHERFWEWIWNLRPGVQPDPYLMVLARGGGKSTNTEVGVVAMGAPRLEGHTSARNYVLYVCDTQQQADDHVQTISNLLESERVAKYYPQMAERQLSKFGHARAWRRNRLITASGFIVDAMGLDSARRGAKLDELRPDVIVLDDIDNEADSHETVEKKERALTKKILPAGSNDVAVLGAQNVVHPRSIFKKLVDNEADYLMKRRVDGPIPAIEDLETEQEYSPELGRRRYKITGGTPTWPEGQGIAVCQQYIDTYGLTSFRVECQHEVEELGGGIFDHLEYRRCDWSEVPDLVRVVLYVDPAVTEKDDSDCMAIQADGIAPDGTIYRLYSYEQITATSEILKVAILKAVELGATTLGVETNQGGDLWRDTYNRTWDDLVDSEDHPLITERTMKPRYRDEKATKSDGSKTERGRLMLEDYERDRIVHVRGTHLVLERALNRAFAHKPFDLADAAYYAWNDLRNKSGGSVHRLN